jgi:hypothetical protein
VPIAAAAVNLGSHRPPARAGSPVSLRPRRWAKRVEPAVAETQRDFSRSRAADRQLHLRHNTRTPRQLHARIVPVRGFPDPWRSNHVVLARPARRSRREARPR